LRKTLKRRCIEAERTTNPLKRSRRRFGFNQNVWSLAQNQVVAAAPPNESKSNAGAPLFSGKVICGLFVEIDHTHSQPAASLIMRERDN